MIDVSRSDGFFGNSNNKAGSALGHIDTEVGVGVWVGRGVFDCVGVTDSLSGVG